MAEKFIKCLTKCSVLLIDIKVIFFVIVIADVNVRPMIVVQIGDSDAKSKSENIIDNTCLFRDIGKFFAIISKEFAAKFGVLTLFKLSRNSAEAGELLG